MLTHHARILNSDNVRIAWGTFNGMTTALDRMVEYLHKHDEKKDAFNNSIDYIEKLKKLKELFDIGAITEKEFAEKKAVLLKDI